MSKEVISACMAFSHNTGEELMLIASLNQINRFGGYVEGWTTRDLVSFVREKQASYPNARMILCRDHLGPGFCNKVDMSEIAHTIEDDIDSGLDLIHIDMCHLPEDQKLQATLEAVRRCAGRVELEVGTDENTGKCEDSIDEMRALLDTVCEIQKPVFVVKQTGSLVREDRQAGTFDSETVAKISRALEDYNVRLKEHNADYLIPREIQKRSGLVGAVNIAPQLGSIQSKVVLSIFPSAKDFKTRCLLSGAWGKWLDEPVEKYSPDWLVSICGHYNFGTPEYLALFEAPHNKKLLEMFVERRVSDVLKTYIEGLRHG